MFVAWQRQFAGRDQIVVMRAMFDFVVQQIDEDTEQQEIDKGKKKQQNDKILITKTF